MWLNLWMFYNFFFHLSAEQSCKITKHVQRLPKMVNKLWFWCWGHIFLCHLGLDDDDDATILEFRVSHVSEKGECLWVARRHNLCNLVGLVQWHTTSLVGHVSFAISILTQETTLVLIWGCMKKGGRNEGFILNYLGIPYFLRQFCEDILAEWAHLFRLPDSGPWDFCCFVGQNKRRNLQICNINTHATQNWNLKRKSLSLQPATSKSTIYANL